jgi:hypothetical protein
VSRKAALLTAAASLRYKTSHNRLFALRSIAVPSAKQ